MQFVFFDFDVLNEHTEHLIADEFSAELAEGVAYVSGHDEESRPVVVIPLINFLFILFYIVFCTKFWFFQIFRFKQDYQKLHSQKL